MTSKFTYALTCPRCRAATGTTCVTSSGRPTSRIHNGRMFDLGRTRRLGVESSPATDAEASSHICASPAPDAEGRTIVERMARAVEAYEAAKVDPTSPASDAEVTVSVDYRAWPDDTIETLAVPANARDYRAHVGGVTHVADPDEITLSDAEIDMTEAARVVRELYGVPCEVVMTGGNVATIYAGTTYVDSTGGERHACIAGPGRYGWDGVHSTGAASEFSVGADDDGETWPPSVAQVGAWTTYEIAALIAAQATRSDVTSSLSAEELDALGFDGSQHYRRDAETLTPDLYAAQVLSAILSDVAAGIVPAAQVASFVDLHDHVDANEYLIDAEVPFDDDLPLPLDVRLVLTNLVTGIVDHAIRSGALVATSTALADEAATR
jgi:hypothetical protein